MLIHRLILHPHHMYALQALVPNSLRLPRGAFQACSTIGKFTSKKGDGIELFRCRAASQRRSRRGWSCPNIDGDGYEGCSESWLRETRIKEILDGSKDDCGYDIMKGIIVISLILLAGLASAYTPEQQITLDGMNLSFRLGMAYEKAIQGQNVAEYNALVDEYNAWIRQHFGEDTNLLMSKLNEPTTVGTTTAAGTSAVTNPFNSSSELSKFGKQQVYRYNRPQTPEDISQQELRDFLKT